MKRNDRGRLAALQTMDNVTSAEEPELERAFAVVPLSIVLLKISQTEQAGPVKLFDGG